MMRNKRLLSLVFGLCMTASAIPALGSTTATDAGEKTYNLVMWTREGPTFAFAFADKPKVTIEGKVFKVTSLKTNMDCRARDMDKFTIEEGDAETGVEAPVTATPMVRLTPGQLLLRGCRPHSTVEIFTVDGKLADSRLTDDDGQLTLDTGGYGNGIIIVKTETTSVKIVNAEQ